MSYTVNLPYILHIFTIWVDGYTERLPISPRAMSTTITSDPLSAAPRGARLPCRGRALHGKEGCLHRSLGDVDEN